MVTRVGTGEVPLNAWQARETVDETRIEELGKQLEGYACSTMCVSDLIRLTAAPGFADINPQCFQVAFLNAVKASNEAGVELFFTHNPLTKRLLSETILDALDFCLKNKKGTIFTLICEDFNFGMVYQEKYQNILKQRLDSFKKLYFQIVEAHLPFQWVEVLATHHKMEALLFEVAGPLLVTAVEQNPPEYVQTMLNSHKFPKNEALAAAMEKMSDEEASILWEKGLSLYDAEEPLGSTILNIVCHRLLLSDDFPEIYPEDLELIAIDHWYLGIKQAISLKKPKLCTHILCFLKLDEKLQLPQKAELFDLALKACKVDPAHLAIVKTLLISEEKTISKEWLDIVEKGLLLCAEENLDSALISIVKMPVFERMNSKTIQTAFLKASSKGHSKIVDILITLKHITSEHILLACRQLDGKGKPETLLTLVKSPEKISEGHFDEIAAILVRNCSGEAMGRLAQAPIFLKFKEKTVKQIFIASGKKGDIGVMKQIIATRDSVITSSEVVEIFKGINDENRKILPCLFEPPYSTKIALDDWNLIFAFVVQDCDEVLLDHLPKDIYSRLKDEALEIPFGSLIALGTIQKDAASYAEIEKLFEMHYKRAKTLAKWAEEIAKLPRFQTLFYKQNQALNALFVAASGFGLIHVVSELIWKRRDEITDLTKKFAAIEACSDQSFYFVIQEKNTLNFRFKPVPLIHRVKKEEILSHLLSDSYFRSFGKVIDLELENVDKKDKKSKHLTDLLMTAAESGAKAQVDILLRHSTTDGNLFKREDLLNAQNKAKEYGHKEVVKLLGQMLK